MSEKIYLNDLLQICDLSSWKLVMVHTDRFGWNTKEAIRAYRADRNELLRDHIGFNWKSHYSYEVGTKIIGLARLDLRRYLLTNIATVISRDDADRESNRHPYTFEQLSECEKWEGRVVVDTSYKGEQTRIKAPKFINDFWVHQVLPADHEWDDDFPGYHNVDLSWHDLAAIIKAEVPSWKTALKNQKGVYLITDTSNGKRYVGSASGNDELWGRFAAYVRTGHGGNIELQKLNINHIKNYFRYTLLETAGALTERDYIIARESHWKRVLLTRKPDYGYNEN